MHSSIILQRPQWLVGGMAFIVAHMGEIWTVSLFMRYLIVRMHIRIIAAFFIVTCMLSPLSECLTDLDMATMLLG